MLNYIDKWVYARGVVILLAVLWMALCIVKAHAHVEIHIEHTPEIDSLNNRLEEKRNQEALDRYKEEGWDNLTTEDQQRLLDWTK